MVKNKLIKMYPFFQKHYLVSGLYQKLVLSCKIAEHEKDKKFRLPFLDNPFTELGRAKSLTSLEARIKAPTGFCKIQNASILQSEELLCRNIK